MTVSYILKSNDHHVQPLTKGYDLLNLYKMNRINDYSLYKNLQRNMISLCE